MSQARPDDDTGRTARVLALIKMLAVRHVAVSVIVLGALILCFGVWMLLPAAGFITAGLLTIGVGVLQLDIGGEK